MDVLFITRKYPPSVGGMQKLNYKVITEVEKLVNSYIIAWGGSQKWLPLFVITAAVRAILFIITHRVTVLHLGDSVLTPLGLALKWLFHLPTVTMAHGLDVVWSNPLYQDVVPWCLRRMDAIICNSAQTKKECVARGVAPERCTVIPVGIEKEEPLPQNESRAFIGELIGEDLAGDRVLLTVGRLVRRKGVAHFITTALPDIVARYPNVRYLVVGKGPERKMIERAVCESGLEGHVFLLGQVDDATLRRAYASADIFVMPNIPVEGDMEGFGIVALEACAAGLCVVAADLEGIQDAIEDGQNGFLIPPDNADGYVNTILELLADDRRRVEMGQRARRYVQERFSWEVIASAYLEVFEQVISEADGRKSG